MNGKGDKPRNCQSEDFRSNYEEINWSCKSVQVQVNEDKDAMDTLDVHERLSS